MAIGLIVGDESLSSCRRSAASPSSAPARPGREWPPGLEEALGPRVLAEKQVDGWINVPAIASASWTDPFTCTPPARLASTSRRPRASPAPRRFWKSSASLGPNDLCFCLISGGGSALLPAPVARRFAGRQAGRHAAAQRRRREYPGAEHRPQAAQPHQRRRPGPPLPRRPTDHADHLRRARRSARRDRLRPDGGSPTPPRPWRFSAMP